MGKNYGYVRVSSRDQHLDRQLISFREEGIPKENIYQDKLSGRDFERPGWNRLLGVLKKDDVLFVKSLDRLGRNYEEIIEQWKIITKEKNADIVILDMPLLDTREKKNLLGTLITDIVLALLSYVAENERVYIRSRQKEGIAAAHERGVKFGRPKKELPEEFQDILERYNRGEIPGTQAAEACGIPVSSFYYFSKHLRE